MEHLSALPLRVAREDDIDRIMELEAGGFAPAIRESREVMLTRLRHFPQGFLVLEHDLEHGGAQVIGYLCSERWTRGAADGGQFDPAHFTLGHDIRDTHHANGDCLYISSMTIAPAHRGNGMGRRFFTQALALLRQRLPGLRASVLLLSAEWQGAQRIYQSCGYTEIARLDGFFADIAQEDAGAIVMQLALDR